MIHEFLTWAGGSRYLTIADWIESNPEINVVSPKLDRAGDPEMQSWHKSCDVSALLAAWLCAVSLFSQSAQAQSTAESEPWFQRAIVGMEVGPTGAQFGYSDPRDKRYCAQWDGAEIVRRCVGAGAEYLVLWLRDGDFAYYDSKLLPKAPGLGTRDPLCEAMEEAKKQKLPIISYCVVQQGGNYLHENPQWKMRDSAGNEIGRFCFNSGYLGAMKQIVAEQLAYGIDGFHIDMLDQEFGNSPMGLRVRFRSRSQLIGYHPLLSYRLRPIPTKPTQCAPTKSSFTSLTMMLPK